MNLLPFVALGWLSLGVIAVGAPRSDVKELGDVIDDGQAALIIVGDSKLEQALDKATLKAEKHVAKELDVSPKDIDKTVQEAAGDGRTHPSPWGLC